jgi:hypothetical protein
MHRQKKSPAFGIDLELVRHGLTFGGRPGLRVALSARSASMSSGP